MVLLLKNLSKVEMTSGNHGPYGSGYTRVTMVGTMRSNDVSLSKTFKIYLSPDRSLQLDYVKMELLVIADQHVAVK